MIPTHIAAEISDHLDAIKRLWKNPKLTLLIRNPDLQDGDFVMTDDTLEAAISALQKRQKADPA